MTDSEALRWVMQHMPVEADAALAKFLEMNRQMTGSGWDDCLAMMLDADAHLAITEPVVDLLPEADPTLAVAVTLTILYSSEAFAVHMDDIGRASDVAATIRAHP